MTAQEIRSRLQDLASPQKAKILQGFFKTGPGEYGEGDIFLGVTVPQLRRVALTAVPILNKDLLSLLRSRTHEERLVALLILVHTFQQSTPEDQEKIFNIYLRETRFINNWDLVDLSAPKIVGAFLFHRDRSPLYTLSRSPLLWERRIAIVATYHFIKNRQWDDTLAISRQLIQDKEDLIHKAVGWMLREVGKQSPATLERFLDQHGPTLPRTMLRYAIERFPEVKRRAYLSQGLRRRVTPPRP